MNLGESEVIQCPILFYLPHSSIHGIFQARVLEWVAISFFRVSSQCRDQTWVSHIVGRCFTIWATREFRWGGYKHLDHSSYYLNIIYSFISFFHFQAMCLFIRWISCVVGSCFDFFPPHFVNLCLLFALFNSFTLCVITEMVILMSGIMLFVFYMFYVVFVHLFLDYYKFGIRYFFIYHLNFRVCVCVWYYF